MTIRGWLDFKGGVYRDRHAHVYKALIINKAINFVCTYNARLHTYDAIDPLPCMWQDFEVAFIGTSWKKHVHGDISRAAEFRGAARFRGNIVVDNNYYYHDYNISNSNSDITSIYNRLHITFKAFTHMVIVNTVSYHFLSLSV